MYVNPVLSSRWRRLPPVNSGEPFGDALGLFYGCRPLDEYSVGEFVLKGIDNDIFVFIMFYICC